MMLNIQEYRSLKLTSILDIQGCYLTFKVCGLLISNSSGKNKVPKFCYRNLAVRKPVFVVYDQVRPAEPKRLAFAF